MLKYIIENGLFFITVNYREDPLGFPSTKNLTIDEMEKLANIEIENQVCGQNVRFCLHTLHTGARKGLFLTRL